MKLIYKFSKQLKKPDCKTIIQRMAHGWSEWDAKNISKGVHRATFWHIQYKHALKEIERLKCKELHK